MEDNTAHGILIILNPSQMILNQIKDTPYSLYILIDPDLDHSNTIALSLEAQNKDVLILQEFSELEIAWQKRKNSNIRDCTIYV